jgi:hypothetical protein
MQFVKLIRKSEIDNLVEQSSTSDVSYILTRGTRYGTLYALFKTIIPVNIYSMEGLFSEALRCSIPPAEYRALIPTEEDRHDELRMAKNELRSDPIPLVDMVESAIFYEGFRKTKTGYYVIRTGS